MDFPLPRDTVPAIFQHRMLQWLHLQRDMGFAEQIRLLLERLRNISFGASGVVPDLGDVTCLLSLATAVVGS